MPKSIDEKEYEKLTPKEKRKYVKEWRCKCNECGKQWSYLDSVARDIERQIAANAITGLSMCCNPMATGAANTANTNLKKQLTDLRRCPRCGSSNATCKAKYFKKQE